MFDDGTMDDLVLFAKACITLKTALDAGTSATLPHDQVTALVNMLQMFAQKERNAD